MHFLQHSLPHFLHISAQARHIFSHIAQTSAAIGIPFSTAVAHDKHM